MSDPDLTQAEADALIALAKHRLDATEWDYPDLGGAISIPLVSTDRREQFLLDLRRGRIDLARGTYQNRGRQVIVLVRLDFGGAPHRNPDGEEISSRISTCIGRDMATSGQCRCRATSLSTSGARGGQSTTLCGSVISVNPHFFGEGSLLD